MHPFIKVFGLTLANCAALCCAGLAFFCYFWCSNPLEAALPFAIFALFCAFQPWLLVVCVLCGAAFNYDPYTPQSGIFCLILPFVLAFATTYSTQRVYRTLYLRGKLTGLLRNQAYIKAGIIGILCLGLLVSFAGYKDLPKQNATPNTAPISPFFHLSESGVKIAATNVHFYVLPNNETERLWQAHVPRAQMKHFEAFSGMRRVPEETFSSRFWDKPPYWWRHPKGEIRTYKSDGFSEDGRTNIDYNEAAVYDPQTETLFLWEQFFNE